MTAIYFKSKELMEQAIEVLNKNNLHHVVYPYNGMGVWYEKKIRVGNLNTRQIREILSKHGFEFHPGLHFSIGIVGSCKCILKRRKDDKRRV